MKWLIASDELTPSIDKHNKLLFLRWWRNEWRRPMANGAFIKTMADKLLENMKFKKRISEANYIDLKKIITNPAHPSNNYHGIKFYRRKDGPQ